MTITVKYSCKLCGLDKVDVVVPARGTEDVLTWMDTMGRFLGEDHHRRSPYCTPTKLQDVMIPMTGTDRVGGPTKN